MDWLVETLQQFPELSIFLALALGYSLGSLRIGSFSVGSVTGIYFTGAEEDIQQWARVSFQVGVHTVVTSDRRILAQAVVGQNAAHQPFGGVYGQAADIEIQAEEILKTKDNLISIMAKCTGQSIERIREDSDREGK